MGLELCPVDFNEAAYFVNIYHRHHQAPQGHKFSIGCKKDGELKGVVMVGRPVARHLDNGVTLEVTRLCTDGTRNASSMLYGAACRAAAAMGYKRLVTYILKSETGLSLKAAGWRFSKLAGGGSWDRPNRHRIDKHPTEQKQLWEAEIK